MASTREENVYMAKLAEDAQRFEEMVEFMKKAMELAKAEVSEPTVEEGNLLTVAYRRLSDALRESWRTVSSIMQKEESDGNENRVAAIRDYRAKIESELSSICDGFLSLLDDFLLPTVSTVERRVFYFKLKGDYHRYLAEFKMAADRKEAVKAALDAYTIAHYIALARLVPTNPVRLELELNISVFYHHILNLPHLALRQAKQAFNDAYAAFDVLGEEPHLVEFTTLMKQLASNIRVWSKEEPVESTYEIRARRLGK